MWMLIVLSIWAHGVEAKAVQVFDSQNDCLVAKSSLTKGRDASFDADRRVTVYECYPAPKKPL